MNRPNTDIGKAGGLRLRLSLTLGADGVGIGDSWFAFLGAGVGGVGVNGLRGLWGFGVDLDFGYGVFYAVDLQSDMNVPVLKFVQRIFQGLGKICNIQRFYRISLYQPQDKRCSM